MNNKTLLVVAGGAGLLGWYLSRQPGGIGGALNQFRTRMVQSPNEMTYAAEVAARAGRRPDQGLGSSGSGQTSILPVVSTAISSTASILGRLFQTNRAGNAPSASRPQTTSGIGEINVPVNPVAGQVYGPYLDDPTGSQYFDPYSGQYYDPLSGEWLYSPTEAALTTGYVAGESVAYAGQETITSDFGTYDVLTGEWY